MAISYIADDQANSASVTSLTVTEPAGATLNDVIIAAGLRNSNTDDGDWVLPADFNAIALNLNETLGTNDGQLFLAYKVRASGAGSGYTFDFGSGSTAAPMTVMLQCWRGVDPTNPIDVAFVQANHYIAYNNGANSAAKPITTVTDGAEVCLYQMHNQSLGAGGAVGGPSGYTLRGTGSSATSGARSMQGWSKSIATAGLETPGVYTHTDVNGTTDPRNFTIALRPLVAAAGQPLIRRLGGVYGCGIQGIHRDRSSRFFIF